MRNAGELHLSFRRTAPASGAATVAIAILLAVSTAPAQLYAQLPGKSTLTPLPVTKPSSVAVQPLRPTGPNINSVTPQGCVRVNDRATIGGSNFGSSRPTGMALGVQPQGGLIKPVTESTWTATIISFLVPAGAGLIAGSPFTVGIVKDNAFIATHDMALCAAIAPQTTPSVASAPKPPLSLGPGISSVTPKSCVRVNTLVTVNGANFGAAKPADCEIGVQPPGGVIRAVAASTWSATSVSFKVPSGAGLAAGSPFTVGIVRKGAFVASTQLEMCASSILGDDGKIRQVTDFKPAAPHVPDFGKFPPTGASAGAPTITSLSPDCADSGHTVAVSGSGFGSSSQAAGFSLGVQWGIVQYDSNGDREFVGRDWKPVMPSGWSDSSITFGVPPKSPGDVYFLVGFDDSGTYVWQDGLYSCEFLASLSGGDSGTNRHPSGRDYDPSWDYPEGDPGSGHGYPGGVSPPSAKRLSPGATDVQVEATPPQDEPAAPAEPGSRPAVGGKAIAMRTLARRGLRKVNVECDLFDAHCPCCRKDDSVCFEKERDNDDGTSVWVVSVKQGAKGSYVGSAYGSGDADEDVEAVTGLQCDLGTSGAEGNAGGIVLICR